MSLSRTDKKQRGLYGLLAVLLALVVVAAWSYWPVMKSLFADWQRDDDYSAGQLVPFVALFLVWRDRKILGACGLKPCWWGGITLLVLAGWARVYGLLYLYESAERYALVLTTAGLVLLVAGWQVSRRAIWILLFPFLMIPLPGQIHNMIGGPLQRVATTGSVFLLEVSGARVTQQGNIMMLNHTMPLAVAEACSGLRMLMTFVIVTAFIAYMVKRPWPQKAILLASSVAIGVICNIVRIFATAVVMLFVGAAPAEKFFHDFAGLIMMPIAVLLIFSELWLMGKLVMPDPPQSGAGS